MSTGSSTAAGTAHVGKPDRPRGGRQPVLSALLLSTVVLQRIALPAGSQQIALILPVALGLLALAVHRGEVRLDLVRTRLYLFAMATMTALALVSYARGLAVSLTSLVFLLLLYIPASFRVERSVDLARLRDLFIRTMSVAAVLGLLQLLLQYAGVPYSDWLSSVVPRSFLLLGYNTGDPITYGSSLYRANGVLFLEPSFFSTFLAVALLMVVRRGRGRWVAVLLAAAMVPPLAGSGFVVLLAGVAVLALGPQVRRLSLLAAPIAVAVVLAAVTPIAKYLLRRSTEVSSSGSSSSLRLVQPYSESLPAWLQDPVSLLIGHGPGSVTDLILGTGIEGGLQAPLLPKLLYEYGGTGTVVFLVFITCVFWTNWRRSPWAPGLLISYYALNAALLQATYAVFTVLLLAVLDPHAHDVDGEVTSRRSTP